MHLFLFELTLLLINNDFLSFSFNFLTILGTCHHLVKVDERDIVEPAHCCIVDNESLVSGVRPRRFNLNGQLRSLRPVKRVLDLFLLSIGVVAATLDLGQAYLFVVVKPGLDVAVEHFLAPAHRLFDKASRIQLDPLLLECFFRDDNWLGLLNLR